VYIPHCTELWHYLFGPDHVTFTALPEFYDCQHTLEDGVQVTYVEMQQTIFVKMLLSQIINDVVESIKQYCGTTECKPRTSLIRVKECCFSVVHLTVCILMEE